MSEITSERYVTESTKPNLVTFNDQFTVDVAAKVDVLKGEERTLSFPIVRDGDPVIWQDTGNSLWLYARLVEDALKVAAMEIAAMRLLQESKSEQKKKLKKRAHRAKVEDLRKALDDSMRIVLGDEYERRATEVQRVVETIDDRSDSQVALLSIDAQFGHAVFGQVLLFQLENRTALKDDAEALSFIHALDRVGMTVADLGWPEEVLHPRYRTPECASNTSDDAGDEEAVAE